MTTVHYEMPAFFMSKYFVAAGKVQNIMKVHCAHFEHEYEQFIKCLLKLIALNLKMYSY